MMGVNKMSDDLRAQVERIVYNSHSPTRMADSFEAMVRAAVEAEREWMVAEMLRQRSIESAGHCCDNCWCVAFHRSLTAIRARKP
jgi:hypothetical protein